MNIVVLVVTILVTWSSENGSAGNGSGEEIVLKTCSSKVAVVVAHSSIRTYMYVQYVYTACLYSNGTSST